jgi:hypothetical protein
MQRIERLKLHAKKMYYPHHREKFLQMATEKSQHAGRIGKKIVVLWGRLPDRGGASLNGQKQLAIFVDGSRRRKSLSRPSMRATPEIIPMTPEKR